MSRPNRCLQGSNILLCVNHSLAHGVLSTSAIANDTLSALTEDGLWNHQPIGTGIDHVQFLPAVAPVALGDLGESPSAYNLARGIVIAGTPNVIFIPLGEVSQGRARQLARHVAHSTHREPVGRCRFDPSRGETADERIQGKPKPVRLTLHTHMKQPKTP